MKMFRFRKQKSGMRRQYGQMNFGILALLPVFLVSMVIVVDFGRFIVLRNQTKIYADGAALAAAGALDVNQATSNAVWAIDPAWANLRASEGVALSHASNPPDGWMTFSVSGVSVSGNYVSVTVNGSAPTLWAGSVFGIGGWRTSVTSRARASAGITDDIAP